MQDTREVEIILAVQYQVLLNCLMQQLIYRLMQPKQLPSHLSKGSLLIFLQSYVKLPKCFRVGKILSHRDQCVPRFKHIFWVVPYMWRNP